MKEGFDVKQFDIQDRDDTNYGPAEIEKQIAIKFDLPIDCNIEIWMRHDNFFDLPNAPVFAEKLTTERLKTGTTTIIHDVDDYLNRQYYVYVFVYTSETGNTVKKVQDIPLEELSGRVLKIKC